MVYTEGTMRLPGAAEHLVVGSWATAPPPETRAPAPSPWHGGDAMRIRGLTFVGTSTTAASRMAALLDDVLGLEPAPVEGSGHQFFALPDGSSFAVGSADDDGTTHRTIGFLVDDVDAAAAELRAAGVPTDDEVSANARYRYVHFVAPDGHVYELVEEVEP
jgi:glyoxylase I family protein